MLTVYENLPDGLLACEAHELHQVLPGPSLVHLDGQRQQPLYVSVLLHGNEATGWQAVREVLKRYTDTQLPRALSLFIGNVEAAAQNQRFLDHQMDYNRIWKTVDMADQTEEHKMAQQVLKAMALRNPFAAIDIHNNTGINPHYGCVNRLDHRFLHLATLFSRTVVYFTQPDTVHSLAFAPLCPSVTVECGQAGQAHGTEHARDFIDACLRLSTIPDHPVAQHDIDLFHTVAIATIPAGISIGFGDEEKPCDVRFVRDLDHLNFRELQRDTRIGSVAEGVSHCVAVHDANGHDVTNRYFDCSDGELRIVTPVMPSMLTVKEKAIRQDCLCYLMERHPVVNGVYSG
ncbi:MAG: M14 family metallopeptidase [Gammaproteobacteria bacterium]|nr:M14 family metallopeptidase [Gammaproteobacteria bacterium]